MTSGILHLPLVLDIFSKRGVIIPAPGHQKVVASFQMESPRRYVVATVPCRIVSAVIYEGVI